MFGVPVQLNWSWFVIFALHVWAISSLRFPAVAPGYPPWEYWVTGFVVTGALLSSVLAHELSHSLMAKAEGIGVDSITLHIFGGVSRMQSESPNPLSDFRIGIVGPASSFLIGAVFYIVRQVIGYFTDSHLLFDAFGYVGLVNLALAAFNLLPGFPLDGGRALRAWLWKRKGDYTAATVAACKSGRNIAFILMFTGIIFGLRAGEYLIVAFSIWVGIFLLDVVATSLHQIKGITGERRAGNIMLPAVDIAPDLLLSELVNRIDNRDAPTRYPVAVDKRLHGILTLEQVREIPPERWGKIRARDVMLPVDSSLFVSSRATIPQVSATMKKNGLGFVAVIDGDGFLVGAITADKLKRIKD